MSALLALFVGCTPEKSGDASDPDVPTDPSRPTEPTDPGPTDTTDPTTPTDTDTDTEPVGPQSVLQFDGPAPTNLVVVSLDTTRRDYIGRFAGNGNTPNLDAMLDEGVALDDHRSCSSWTAPSMTCVTTGNTPFELGFWPWNDDPQVPNRDNDLPTLATLFTEQKGYRTTLVTSNTVFDDGLSFTNGFDTVLHPSWMPAAAVTDDGLSAARDLVDAGDPFYLHVHFIDPHASYCPPEDYVDAEYGQLGEDICNNEYDLGWQYWFEDQDWRDRFLSDVTELYDAELEYWDVEFGRLMDGLRQMGALDDALVVFVTDHGEQFFERGSMGHGNTLGAEEHRSTAGFWAETLVPQAWSGATVHQDLAATIHDHFGLVPPTPTSGAVVGLAPEERAVRGMLYWDDGGAQLSVTRGGLQLTYDFWGDKHLFDLTLDPTGLEDFYDPGDPDVIALWAEMDPFVDEILAQWPSAGPAVDRGP